MQNWIGINGQIAQRAYKYQDLDDEEKNKKRENPEVSRHCHINSWRERNERIFSEHTLSYQIIREWYWVEWKSLQYPSHWKVYLVSMIELSCVRDYFYNCNYEFSISRGNWQRTPREVDTRCNFERFVIVFFGEG